MRISDEQAEIIGRNIHMGPCPNCGAVGGWELNRHAYALISPPEGGDRGGAHYVALTRCKQCHFVKLFDLDRLLG